MLEYMCISCGQTFVRFNSLQRKCGRCAYNLNAKPKKPMKRMGKVGKEWLDTRNEWIKQNPPNHQGLWQCAIRISPQCLGWVDIDQLQVDHIKARSKRQDLRNEQSNLQPSCSYCNSEKSSKSLDNT